MYNHKNLPCDFTVCLWSKNIKLREQHINKYIQSRAKAIVEWRAAASLQSTPHGSWSFLSIVNVVVGKPLFPLALLSCSSPERRTLYEKEKTTSQSLTSSAKPPSSILLNVTANANQTDRWIHKLFQSFGFRWTVHEAGQPHPFRKGEKPGVLLMTTAACPANRRVQGGTDKLTHSRSLELFRCLVVV